MTLGVCPATLLTDPMGAADAQVHAACRAAAGAGFTSASVWAQHLPAVAGSGLRVEIVEAATTWGNGSPADAATEADRLVGCARDAGAAWIMAVCLEPSFADLARARDHLGTLVDRAAGAGIGVCVEFLPGTAVPDLATAWDLVQPLGAPAAILLDAWHWTRQPGGPDFDLLATIPGDRIGVVQLCDAAATPGPDVMAEMMTGRLLPGEGAVDFARLFAALGSTGAAPYLCTEIFNPALVDELGAGGAAQAMMASATRVLPAA